MKNSKTMWIFLGIILAIYSSIVWIVGEKWLSCFIVYIYGCCIFVPRSCLENFMG